MKVGAIVLAAGAATRFGAPTQLALLDGRPLVGHALAALAAVPQADPVIVVLGAHAEFIEPQLPAGRHRVAHCADWRDGIAASLRCGLRAAGPLDAALVLLGDQPFVGSALVLRVLREGLPQLAGGRFDAARPVSADGRPGHPVLLGAAGIAAARHARGDRGLGPLLEHGRVHAITGADPAATLDIDRPDELRAARERLHLARLAA